MKPILLLDFDGVLHSYESGWQGVDNITDDPVDGAQKFVREAKEYFKVCVYSARSCQEGGIEAMKAWMEKHDFDLTDVDFPTEKPGAFLTIDDRCICFDGRFPFPKWLLSFKPWNKQEV